MPPISTSITSVTVYPDRARVTRSGTATLEKGLQQLEIPELTLNANPDSLRVAARGTARARLLGAQVKRAFYTETPAEQVRQLEEQIEALQDELKQADAQAELIKQQRSTLDKVAGHTDKFALALASGEMTLDTQMSLFDGLRTRAEKLDNELSTLLISRRDLDRRLQKLTKELEQQRSARPRERYTATIEAEVLQPGDLTLELNYMVTGAGWKPLYDLRLVETNGAAALEVGYLGQVTQTTGEPWENIVLTLSTARPALTHTLPELQPWYIRPLPPPMPRAAVPQAAPTPGPMKAKVVRSAGVAAGESFALGAEPVEAEVAVASVESSGTAVTYVLPATANIPPDGASHKVTVAQFSLSPRLDYVAAPKLVEAVYRRAKITNASLYTLLPGNANIFIGDEFIGASPLEMTAPQGEIELYLGVEDRIKIERELKRRDVGKQLIGGKRHFSFGYEIRLENLLPSAATVKLHDQIPVPRHEEIKVRLEAADPKPTELSELNLLKWELSLGPGEKRSVRFDFSVEAPQAMEVIGLP
jgi:uncharacterized protein (TIGR02231 family)